LGLALFTSGAPSLSLYVYGDDNNNNMSNFYYVTGKCDIISSIFKI